VRLALHHPRPANGPLNSLQGEVVEAIYEGGSRRWTVRLESGERLVVRESNSGNGLAAGGAARGAHVYLIWEPASSLVYSPEATSLASVLSRVPSKAAGG
jgi:hypothetical protein